MKAAALGTRRTVGVLFCDLVDSTRLQSALGLDRSDELRRRLFSALRECIAANSGEEVKNLGDGLFVTFPIAAGDAVPCAVAMQRAVARLNLEGGPAPLSLRIGLAAGDALHDPDEDDWFGPPVNAAARLCAASGPDQILATDALLGLVPSWPSTPVGALGLKGIPQPVPTSAVDWEPELLAASVPLPASLDARHGLPFVGRDRSLAELDRTVELSASGPVVVTVSGEPGSGKTRLVSHWIGRRRRALGTVVGGSCEGEHDLVASVADAMRWYVAATSDTRLVEGLGGDLAPLTDEVPGLRRRFPVTPPPDVEPSRTELARALGRWLASIARDPAADRDGPVVLVVDDVHHLDPGVGAEQLAALVDSADDAPLLVVVAGRRTWPTTGSEIALGALAPDEVVDLLRRVAPDGTTGLVALGVELTDLTAGDPGLVADVVGSMVASGDFDRSDDLLESTRVAVRQTCPYRGLAAFRAEDHAVYFGREELVAALVARLRDARAIAIVGASGSGKSSLLAAGLVPALLEDPEGPDVRTMTPGSDPLGSLDRALAGAAGPLVLVVDQFEELYTLDNDEEERSRFADRLLALAAVPQGPSVVLSLRADCYGEAAAHPGLRTLLAHHQVLVGPMQPDELRRVIEQPALVSGLRLEEGLVDTMIRDVGTEPGALPLLSHVLYETWRRRRGRTMTLSGYRDAGGVNGAIAATAERAYAASDDGGRDAARRLFLRLVSLGDASADSRRRARIDELPADAAALVPTFADARLITVDAADVEVAHEALLREWPRLRAWLEEDREGLRLQAHLTEAATTWDRAGRTDADLFRGRRLDTTRRWSDAHADDLNQLEREFLAASQEGAEREARRERTQARRTRVLLVVVSTLLVGAVIAGVLALVQRNEARSQSALAEERRAAAQIDGMIGRSTTMATDEPAPALLLAVEAYRRAPGDRTEGALLAALVAQKERVAFHPATVTPTACNGVVWTSADGSRVYSADGRRVLATDPATGDTAEIGRRPTACATWGLDGGSRTMFAADGDRLWIAPVDGVFGDPIALAGPGWTVTEVAVAPRAPGRLAALLASPTPGAPGVAAVLDVDTSGGITTVAMVDVPAGAATIALDDLGTEVAVGSTAVRAEGRENPSVVTLVDLRTGAHHDLELRAEPRSLQFRSDEPQLAVGEVTGRVSLFDTETGTFLGDPLGPSSTPATSIGFDARGRLLVVTGGSVRFFDLPTGLVSRESILVFGAQTLRVRPDGRLLVVRSDGGTEVHDPGLGVLGVNHVPVPMHWWPEYSADGSTAAALNRDDGVARIVDTRTGEAHDLDVHMPTLPELVTTLVPVSPEVQYGITADLQLVRFTDGVRDRTTRLEDDRDFVLRWGGRSGDLGAIVGTNPDGRSRIYLVDSTSMEPIGKPIEVLGREVTAIPLPDRRVIVFERPGVAVEYSAAGERIRELAVTGRATVAELDGHQLAVGTDRGALQLIDLAEGTVTTIARLDTTITSLAFVRGGSHLVSIGDDNVARLWDLRSREQIGPVHWSVDERIDFTVNDPDSDTLWMTASDHGVEVELDPAWWVRRACLLAGRELTPDEWATYLPGDEPHDICADAIGG